MKLKYFIMICVLFITFGNANEFEEEPNVDCLILEDENSIICKYSHQRVSYDKNITIQWIEPNGLITRERDMLIPAFHGSVYDYRYIEGRTAGKWTFRVIDSQQEFSTTFIVQ